MLQDTGWSRHYPTGDGLLVFSTTEEALAGIDRVNADYARHRAASRRLAEEQFDARRVLGRMLEKAGL